MSKRRISNKFLLAISLFLIINLIISSSGYSIQFPISSEINSMLDEISTDQSLANPSDVIGSIVPYIMDHKNATGSWNFPLHSQDDNVYTGLAGGLAGLGYKLLDLTQVDDTFVTENEKSDALALATEIGDELASISLSNATGRFWNVSVGLDYIDLSHDFGIAGLMKFYAYLFNITQEARFETYALETLEAIDFMSNQTIGLHWNSSMSEILENSFWYPTNEIEAIVDAKFVSAVFLNETYNYTYFNGHGLGTLGVADSILQSIKFLDITDFGSLYYDLLTSSVVWLENQFNLTGTELSFPIAEPSFELYSTSKANGASGAVDFFLDLYDRTNNGTYMTYSNNTMNWLLGIEAGFDRIGFTYLANDTGNNHIELGISHGFAGNLDTLWNYINETGNDNFNATLQSYMLELNSLGQDSDSYYKYPESLSSGSPNNIGALSFATSHSGIMYLLNGLSDYFDTNIIDDDIAKAKAYIFSHIVEQNNYTLIENPRTSTIELNPSFGLPSLIPTLLVRVPGVLEVSTTEVEYGNLLVGNSNARTVQLRNTGDLDMQVSWTDFTSEVFSTSNLSVTVKPHQTFNLFITFNPVNEESYNETITFTSSTDSIFDVNLIGVGYDLPVVDFTNVLANNSLISERGTQEFQLTATDTSGITEVTISINGSSSPMTSEVSSDVFSYTWDKSNIQNGTYIIDFTVTDTVGNVNQTTFVYTVGVYDPSLQEQIFSTETLIILVAITVVVIITAIFVTKRISN